MVFRKVNGLLLQAQVHVMSPKRDTTIMHILNDVNMRKRLERVGESSGDREDAFVNISFNGFQNSLDRYTPVAVVRAHVLKV